MKRLFAALVVSLAVTVGLPVCAGAVALTIVDVCSTDASWNYSESRPHSPVLPEHFTADGLVLDITGDRTHDAANAVGGKVAGYIAVDPPVNLSDVNGFNAVLGYNGLVKPGYQLVIDRDGNPATYDGILVGEPVYGANWWASTPAVWPELDASIHQPGGGGPVSGTLTAFHGVDADATVIAVGFSLGTLAVGQETKGTLSSLTFNNTQWKFGVCELPVTTTTTTPVTTTTDPTVESPMDTSSTSTSSTPAETTMSSTLTVATSTSKPAVVLVGGPVDRLANTGTDGSSLTVMLLWAGVLVLLGAASFVILHIQRKRSTR